MSTGADKSKDSSKKGNGMMIAFIISLIVVVIAVILIVVLVRRKGNDNSPANDTVSEETQRREVVSDVRTVLDEDSGEEIMNQMREEVAEGMFECQMSMSWSFPDGKSASEDAYVANSTNNTHPIYFDVILDGTEEVIYSSPVMPVGTELTGFKLDKELDAGTYEATVMYNLLKDEESQEVISSAGFIVTINILK
jgi:hypothetical protein